MNNILEVAFQVFSQHPFYSAGGAAVSVVTVWKGAKAGLKRFNEHLKNERRVEEILANLPEPTPWLPPEKRPRL